MEIRFSDREVHSMTIGDISWPRSVVSENPCLMALGTCLRRIAWSCKIYTNCHALAEAWSPEQLLRQPVWERVFDSGLDFDPSSETSRKFPNFRCLKDFF